MNILDLIKSRRSVREFIGEEVSDEQIAEILEAGQWAPSGLNNQPWRFVIIKDTDVIEKIADCTKYSHVVNAAKTLLAVFLDNDATYNRTKDVQAIGAAIQNMLLAIHGLQLGACWLGEILNQRDRVEQILEVPESFELMAVLAVGHPKQGERMSSRKPLEKMIFKK